MNALQPWNVVFLVGFAFYLGIRGRFAQRAKGNALVERRVDAVERALLALVGVSSLVLPLVYLFTPLLSFADVGLSLPVQGLGAMLMVLALWLFWRSHADLGLNWSVSLEVREGHELVRDGVYRRVRHPMYSAIGLWSVAQGLVLENWLAGWGALAACGVLFAVRTPREEKMMRAHFGGEYEDYMAGTGRLWPRLSSRRGQ